MSEEKDDTMEFVQYCKRERDNFVRGYWKSELHYENAVMKKRVQYENLLIAYDQLIDRLLKKEVK